MFVGFTLEAKLVSSKNLIHVHLEILSRSVENMASNLLTWYSTWSKTSQSVKSNLSVARVSTQSLRCTCTSCTWLPFLNSQVCSQVWCRPYFGAHGSVPFLLVKCVLKCGVDHTLWPTSASLNSLPHKVKTKRLLHLILYSKHKWCDIEQKWCKLEQKWCDLEYDWEQKNSVTRQ